MILEIQNTSRLHGERDTTLSKKRKISKLSQEILGVFAITAAISIFFFGFLSVTADSLVASYCDKYEVILTEMQEWTINSWIDSISLVSAVLLLVILFLFLTGQKLAYLRDIIQGIDALHMHRMDYEIPVEGDNELTELAESINFLSKTERELQQKEAQMREEKEQLIRALSHDIRTPLTSILAYSEYMKTKENITEGEMDEYITLMQQKAEQIKGLTNRLLDGGGRTLEFIEHGHFFVEQLVGEWEAMLEDDFTCEINLKECPEFSCKVDIQELQRIFDNLASNVEKYADAERPVCLSIFENEEYLVIEQKNHRKQKIENVESNKIGLESIRKIAEHYSGNIETELTEQEFCIRIALKCAQFKEETNNI